MTDNAQGPAASIRRPGLWLLGILGLALALRVWWLSEQPLQIDEFAALYAVAERASSPGWLPAAESPLQLVPDPSSIPARSVLPLGIANPYPLYHWLLYATLRALPIDEWSLRLPSLLAGIGCVAVVYAIGRRLLGSEVGLAAALFAALDPIQIETSVLALPSALGNLTCALSFLALSELCAASRPIPRAVALLSYGLSTALLGYCCAASLPLAVAGHLGFALAGQFGRGGRPAPLLMFLAGLCLAAALLPPQAGYFLALSRAARAHYEHLQALNASWLGTLLLHNSGFLVVLVVVAAASSAFGKLNANDDANGAGNAAAAAVPAENPAFLWLGRSWLFLPQLAALLLASLLHQPVLRSTYLSFTTLGGVLLLGYYATREPRTEARRAVIVCASLALLLWGFLPGLSLGRGLVSRGDARLIAEGLDQLKSWQPGDVLLYRANAVEADLLPNGVPAASRPHLEGILAAPLTTLYVPRDPRPFVLLSLSHRRGAATAKAGLSYEPAAFYNDDLARQLRGHTGRFWLCSLEPDRPAYFDCLLPWLATALNGDLKVARREDHPDGRYFVVPVGIGVDDLVPGLGDGQPEDFRPLVLIQRVPGGDSRQPAK